MDLHTYTVLACTHTSTLTQVNNMSLCNWNTEAACSVTSKARFHFNRQGLSPSWRLCHFCPWTQLEAFILGRQYNSKQMAKYELGSTKVYIERGRYLWTMDGFMIPANEMITITQQVSAPWKWWRSVILDFLLHCWLWAYKQGGLSLSCRPSPELSFQYSEFTAWLYGSL